MPCVQAQNRSSNVIIELEKKTLHGLIVVSGSKGETGIKCAAAILA